MKCDEVLQELELYLDGELETGGATGLAEHLAECSSCFDRAEFARRLRAIVREKCLSEPPARLWSSLRQALETGGSALDLPSS